MSRVTAVIVAYGDQPLLPAAVESVLASRGVEVEVVLVDNGCTDGGVDAVRGLAGVTVIDPGRNLGLDAACGVGIAAGSGDFVALVNSDAVVQPDALATLVAVAADPGVGIATASLRLHDEPDLMNSAGNEVHFLGFSWCGGLSEPASRFTTPRDVASASGAAMVMRRELWDATGGFPSEFFMYYEDAELSLRSWRLGRRVVFVPGGGRHPPLRVRPQSREDVLRGAQPADHDAHAPGAGDARDPDAGHGRSGARDARARLAAGVGIVEGEGLVVARAPPSLDSGPAGRAAVRAGGPRRGHRAAAGHAAPWTPTSTFHPRSSRSTPCSPPTGRLRASCSVSGAERPRRTRCR